MSDLYPNLSGKNHTFVVQNAAGRKVVINGVKDFKGQQDTTNRSSIDKDGVRWEAEQPVGYSGSFSFNRRDAEFDKEIMASEDAWYDLGQLAYYSIFETIKNPATLETTRFQYERVALKFDNLGDFSGDKDAECSVSFKAQRRREV